MADTDSCCTLVPYFQVHEGKLDTFKGLCEQFVDRTAQESGVLFYAFSFDDHQAHCREGYADAAGVLAHLDNVGDLLQQALQIADITRLEVHGPADQVDQMREPLAELSPQYFVLECGFRR